MLGDAFCDADNERYLSFYSFFNTCGSDGRSIESLVLRCFVHRADTAYGTKIADAVAPVSFMASLTLAKTGFPRCVSPAFFGFVPPTTLVPAMC